MNADPIPHSRPAIVTADINAVTSVMQTGMIAEGKLCEEFEQRFADYLGTPGAVAVSTGTLAIQLALMSVGCSAGDRVLAPTYISRAPLDACHAIGCRPILVDSGPDYNLDIEQLLNLASGCKAAIIPHILGIPIHIDGIREAGIAIVEDCAHSIGGRYNGRKLGTFGDVSMVSFHATKMMTTGEGGIVTSNDRVTVEKMRNIKSNPDTCTSSSVDVANHFCERSLFPLTDIQAALGISQLARLDSFVTRRKEIADRYFTELRDISSELPYHLRERSVFFRFPIKIKGSVERCINEFYKHGVCVRKPVAVLLHQLRGETGDSFPVAERHWRKTISLPIYPSLTEDEIQAVVGAALKVLT